MQANPPNGFTLIEMSIVLVIIGLLVGGVLTGRDLIRAAEVRAQLSQIESYNVAANVFREKYDGLPGDLGAHAARTFGFAARGALCGEGDGNGILQGTYGNYNNCSGDYVLGGETAMFWVDLTTANGLNVHLIGGSFSTAVPDNTPASDLTLTSIPLFFPAAKLGRGNYIYVYSHDGINYYGLSAVTGSSTQSWVLGTSNLPVQSAYAIDKKADDGFPLSGSVTAVYQNAAAAPTLTGSRGGPSGGGPLDTAATAGASYTCYDNGNVGGARQQYSVGQNGGTGANCALSFQFQ